MSNIIPGHGHKFINWYYFDHSQQYIYLVLRYDSTGSHHSLTDRCLCIPVPCYFGIDKPGWAWVASGHLSQDILDPYFWLHNETFHIFAPSFIFHKTSVVYTNKVGKQGEQIIVNSGNVTWIPQEINFLGKEYNNNYFKMQGNLE